MDAATMITISLFAAAGILCAVISAAELAFFSELSKSVTVIRGGADTAEIAKVARRCGLLHSSAAVVIVCNGEEKGRVNEELMKSGIIAVEKKELADTVEYLLNM